MLATTDGALADLAAKFRGAGCLDDDQKDCKKDQAHFGSSWLIESATATLEGAQLIAARVFPILSATLAPGLAVRQCAAVLKHAQPLGNVRETPLDRLKTGDDLIPYPII